MFRITKVAICATALAAGAASTPALAVSARGVATGESLARQMLTLMDTDKNGQVSRDEWMRFMAAEFDRLDVDHSGHLTVRELRSFARPSFTHPGGR